jgi:uncharacterized integral membrane protein
VDGNSRFFIVKSCSHADARLRYPALLPADCKPDFTRLNRITLRFRVLSSSLEETFMNTRLLLRTIFLVAILLLLVIMGMNNRQTVGLSLPPILSKTQKLPAAIMYFGFFAIGVLCGAMLTAGKKAGGGNRSKGQK